MRYLAEQIRDVLWGIAGITGIREAREREKEVDINKIIAEPWRNPQYGSKALIDMIKRGSLKKEDVFRPPKFVRELVAAGWQAAEDYWWEAVDIVFKKYLDKVFVWGPYHHMPNYQLVVSIWKDLIEKELGFRPTRTKEQDMTSQIIKTLQQRTRFFQKLEKKALRKYLVKKAEQARTKKKTRKAKAK